jgi:hypothetical protein
VSALLRRMLGAARLHADTYEEVEADPSAIGQAGFVVVCACAVVGLATWIEATRLGLAPDRIALQVVAALLEPLALWVGGSAVAYMVGASFFRGPETETDFAEVLRTTGFAFTPALLRLLIFVPPPALGLGIDLLARVWTFVAVVIAIRQALDFTTLRAVGTFGVAALMLWLLAWGTTSAPLPFVR